MFLLILINFLSFGIPAYKYDPLTSKSATYLLFYASFTIVLKNPSDDATLSPPFKYILLATICTISSLDDPIYFIILLGSWI